MTTAQRTYRGIGYEPSNHENASSTFVEHIYRGKKYSAPLKHEARQDDPGLELNYRGKVYHHRQNAAAKNINA